MSKRKMEIKEKGKYRLLDDIKTTTSCSIGTIKKGTIITVTQVDEMRHKVIGSPLFGWEYWDMPVEPGCSGAIRGGSEKYVCKSIYSYEANI